MPSCRHGASAKRRRRESLALNPVIRRVVLAYHPLSQRGRLVEGPHPLPPVTTTRPRLARTLFALLATVPGRASAQMPR